MSKSKRVRDRMEVEGIPVIQGLGGSGPSVGRVWGSVECMARGAKQAGRYKRRWHLGLKGDVIHRLSLAKETWNGNHHALSLKLCSLKKKIIYMATESM